MRNAVLTHVRWRPMRLRGVRAALPTSRAKLLILVALFTLAPLAAGSQQPPGIRGFTSGHVPAERERERRLQALPSPDNLREYMRTIAAEPHHAGSPGSRKVADFILGKFKSWGLNASIEPFEALMPYPTERVVELVEPEKYVAALKEPVIANDPDSGDAGQLPTFNAYSADGDVTANLVYVNYGTPEDYEQLTKLGIDVKGTIVIARYGRSWRGIKPKVAAEHGAVGCIIYSDPRDDGFFQGDVYEQGAWRPSRGVQRGSVMDMPLYPGDPLSPGWASEAGSRRLERNAAATLLKIPVLPISYEDAQPLLKSLKGPVAQESWRGALPLTYHLGPGPAKVHLKLTFDWQVRPLYNIIGRIDGSEFPDQWIIEGNHHDAWVNGASDPTSGNVALMETARSLGELLKSGWKPRRTIIIASWDGEEWGLLGSTEWAEKHRDQLAKNAVVYINSDSTGKGWLSMGGSHSLEAFINGVARDVQDPRGSGGSVFDAKRARLLDQATDDAARAKIKASRDLAIDALGSGSDYTAFLDFLQIASLDLGFGGDGGGGVYHSIYDSYYWFSHFSDGDFKHSAALSRVIGTALLRLADGDVLPFEFKGTADALGNYTDDIARMPGVAGKLDVGPLRAAIAKLASAADSYEKALVRLDRVDKNRDQIRSDLANLNEMLYRTERAFRHPAGLPKREWFKHLVYAPGLYTGYGVKTLPGIREGIEQKQWDEARSFVPIVANAVKAFTADVDRATALLKKLNR
jgi:N-acetylated-alpha-linked acidic dipeptidase